ncbi:hypothetical protein K443DRAFT_402080 [Laccaria amethystina LaAM-08-1]|uniref:Uncharacterized protein n=1 Tax=Laccaria amethystina LaAM-08-1 TaxID=1095629 RepID=A0A0C9XAV5_9AGAR|nr:hypothetical protein K443DRAFT_402080 [Laccaria amethystina LaAM-08-1]
MVSLNPESSAQLYGRTSQFKSPLNPRLSLSPPKEIPSLGPPHPRDDPRDPPYLGVLISLPLRLSLFLPSLPPSPRSLQPGDPCTETTPKPILAPTLITPHPSIAHQCLHYHRQIHQPKHQHPRDSHPRTQNCR